MDFWFFLNSILRQLPMLLVVLVGMVFALAHVRRYPKVSFITLLGLFLYLLQVIFFTVFFHALRTFVNRLAFEQGLSTSSQQWIYTTVHVVNSFAYAIVILLLVAAALIQRNKPSVTTAH